MTMLEVMKLFKKSKVPVYRKRIARLVKQGLLDEQGVYLITITFEALSHKDTNSALYIMEYQADTYLREKFFEVLS